MKKKFLVCLLSVIMCFALVGCGSNKDEESYVVESYLEGIVKSDSKKYCDSLAKEVLDYLYADKDECVTSVGNMFDEMSAEYKNYVINDKKLLSDKDLDDLKSGLEEVYKISPEKVEKVYLYSVDINATDYSHDEKLYIYVANMDGNWWIVKKVPR